jgi:hypothetical protein
MEYLFSYSCTEEQRASVIWMKKGYKVGGVSPFTALLKY